MGHNIEEKIKDAAYRYSETLEKSAELNDARSQIREEMKDIGIDTKAFQDHISRMKKELSKKEGYDESFKIIASALKDDGPENLFSWFVARQEAKEEEREKRKEEKEKEKEKADEYKPAAERKPKNGKSIGQQQAEVYQAAHGNA